MTRAAFTAIVPLVPAGADLAKDVAFYRDALGFAVVWESGDMACLSRDGIALNLVRNDERLWADNASFAIAVTGLDALYAEYRGAPARVGPLETKPWGRREFHMILPSGVCLQFHEA
ncbi:MAG TPA: VOC family protein [Rhizomicrobium sp.]|nr:VOC family protein [Rhizomicrobium sp.]